MIRERGVLVVVEAGGVVGVGDLGEVATGSGNGVAVGDGRVVRQRDALDRGARGIPGISQGVAVGPFDRGEATVRIVGVRGRLARCRRLGQQPTVDVVGFALTVAHRQRVTGRIFGQREVGIGIAGAGRSGAIECFASA